MSNEEIRDGFEWSVRCRKTGELLALCESEKIAWCILESLEYMLGEMLIVEEITNE